MFNKGDPLIDLNPLRLKLIINTLKENFGSLKDLKILDIGCREGLVLNPLRRLGAHVIGVDPEAGVEDGAISDIDPDAEVEDGTISDVDPDAEVEDGTISDVDPDAEVEDTLISAHKGQQFEQGIYTQNDSKILDCFVANALRNDDTKFVVASHRRSNPSFAAKWVYKMSLEEFCQQCPDKNQFDAVLALEVIEHIADHPPFIQSVTALLKPGGFLFLSSINKMLPALFFDILVAEHFLSLVPKGTHEFDKFPKLNDLLMLLKADFEVLEILGLNYNPWTKKWKVSNNLDKNFFLVGRLKG